MSAPPKPLSWNVQLSQEARFRHLNVRLDYFQTLECSLFPPLAEIQLAAAGRQLCILTVSHICPGPPPTQTMLERYLYVQRTYDDYRKGWKLVTTDAKARNVRDD